MVSGDHSRCAWSLAVALNFDGAMIIVRVVSGQQRTGGSTLVLIDTDPADGDVKQLIGVQRAVPVHGDRAALN